MAWWPAASALASATRLAHDLRADFLHERGQRVIAQYWSVPPAEFAARLATSEAGLTSAEAARRLAEHGPYELKRQAGLSRFRVLWNQLRSPLLLLLLFAAAASLFSGQCLDASIVIASVGLGYTREYRAERAVAEMRALVVRTRRPFYRSWPGNLLLVSSLAVMALALAIPFIPRAELLGFTPIPSALVAVLVGITVLHVLAPEIAKARFYARTEPTRQGSRFKSLGSG